MTWSAGLIVAINLVLGKTFGEIFLSHVFWKMPTLSASCLLFACLGCLLVVYLLSVSMRYYDNIDVIPMYQSFILLMMLVAGWVVLDEVRLYTRKGIIGIISSSTIVCIGIYILTIKSSVVAHIKKKDDAEPLV